MGLPREASCRQPIRAPLAQIKGAAGPRQISPWLGEPEGWVWELLSGNRRSRGEQNLVLAALA